MGKCRCCKCIQYIRCSGPTGPSGISAFGCTIGTSDAATFPNLLTAFENGCSSVRVIDSFTDTSIISNDMYDDALIYIDPGVVYTFNGSLDLDTKEVAFCGSKANSTLRITTTTSPFSGNGSLSFSNICLVTDESYDDTILTPPYINLSIQHSTFESLNLSPSSPLLIPPSNPSILNAHQTHFIGNSTDLRIVSDLGVTDPNTEIRSSLVSGTFSTSLISGEACFEVTSERTSVSEIKVLGECSFRIGGSVENVFSGDPGIVIPLEIVTPSSSLINAMNLSMNNITVSGCIINNIVNSGNLTLSGSQNKISSLTNTGSLNVDGDQNQIVQLSTTGSLDIDGDNNELSVISISGSSSDLNVGGVSNIVTNAEVSDRTTINGTDCVVNGIISTDLVSVIGQSVLSNFRALSSLNVAGFPGPTVTGGKVTGTSTISSSRASVSNLVTDSITISGIENSVVNVNVQSGGSFTITGVRNTVSGSASTPNVIVGADQCALSGFYFFGGITINGDFCSLSSCRITSGMLIVNGDETAISAVNVTSGVTISGDNCCISSLKMNVSGSLSITGEQCRVTGSNLLSTTVDALTATDCIFGNNTFTSLTIMNGGGGVATDPLLVGNRLPAIPLSIAPASSSNQT